MTADSTAWMPLYIGPYLRHTNRLSAAEHGAYLLLIMDAWVAGGTLPADKDQLRRIARMDEKEWRRSEATILRFFYRDGESYRHERVDAEIAKAKTNIDQRVAAGKASAAARKAKRRSDGGGNEGGNGKSTAVATETLTDPQTEVQRNGRPLPLPTSNEVYSDADASARRPAEITPAPEPPDPNRVLWNQGLDWLIGQGVKRERAQQVIGKWRKAHDPAAILDAMRRAHAEAASEPISFIEGVFRSQSRGPKHGQQPDPRIAALAGIYADELALAGDAGGDPSLRH